MQVSFQSFNPNPEENCPICLDSLSGESAVVAHNDGGEKHPIHLNCLKKDVSRNGERCPSCRKTIDVVSIYSFFERMDYKRALIENNTYSVFEFVALISSGANGGLFGLPPTVKLITDIFIGTYLGIKKNTMVAAYSGIFMYGFGCLLGVSGNDVNPYELNFRATAIIASCATAYFAKCALKLWVSRVIRETFTGVPLARD